MESLSGSVHHRSDQPSRQTTTMIKNQKNLTLFGYLKPKKTAGIDTKANSMLTLHEQLLVFFAMKQGQNE